jgi:uncharacterized protein (DUF1697 family)
MAELRALLGEAGYQNVRTYVQSGNVVLDSNARAPELEAATAKLISDRFGFEVPVISRTEKELAAVVTHNPLGELAVEPKRYQVSFLDKPPAQEVIKAIQEAAVGPEAVAIAGREIYAWHPDGVARSKLWNRLAGGTLGVKATARNWTTVQTLLEMMKG